jgi:hypothetical protein
MSRLRNWVDEVGTSVVAEVIAGVIIVVSILAATIYVFYSVNPQLVLLRASSKI